MKIKNRFYLFLRKKRIVKKNKKFVNLNIVRKFANDIFYRTFVMEMKKKFTEEQQKLARIAKALSHPVRVFVMEFLSKQACCYSGDLTDILPIAKSTLSQHLKELRDAGLIQGELETPKVRYCLNKENWKAAKVLFKDLMQLDGK